MATETPTKLFNVGKVTYLGRNNFKIDDDVIAGLICRHESGDYGDISDKERGLNEIYVKKPFSYPDGSVQSIFTCNGGVVSISTTRINTDNPETEMLFNNDEGGIYDGKKRDNSKPIPPLA